MVEDWKQGRRQALEVSSAFSSRQDFRIDTLVVEYEFKFNLGLILEDGDDVPEGFVRPTDNAVCGEASLKYPVGWTLDPYVSASAQTQITESFRVAKSVPHRTAKLWDPITTQQSLGFAYSTKHGANNLTARLGFSLKQIRAKRHTALTDDRKTREITERYKAESGISFRTDARLQLDSAVNYTGKLDLFGTFDNPEVWVVKFENQFDIKVWKFLGILVELDIYYDESQSVNLQYNQNARFGIVAKI
ncbi:MAG: hypothetical protein ACLFQX_13850 [Candidatus Kapaibacterium sp.]